MILGILSGVLRLGDSWVPSLLPPCSLPFVVVLVVCFAFASGCGFVLASLVLGWFVVVSSSVPVAWVLPPPVACAVPSSSGRVVSLGLGSSVLSCPPGLRHIHGIPLVASFGGVLALVSVWSWSPLLVCLVVSVVRSPVTVTAFRRVCVCA